MQLTKQIGIRLDEETQKKLEQLAMKKRRKLSELVRLIIENYVEQFEDKI